MPTTFLLGLTSCATTGSGLGSGATYGLDLAFVDLYSGTDTSGYSLTFVSLVLALVPLYSA